MRTREKTEKLHDIPTFVLSTLLDMATPKSIGPSPPAASLPPAYRILSNEFTSAPAIRATA